MKKLLLMMVLGTISYHANTQPSPDVAGDSVELRVGSLPEALKKLKLYPGVRWNPGYVHLKSKQQIEGYVCYEPKLELVISYVDAKLQTYAPMQIDSFRYFDGDLQSHRTYQTLLITENKHTHYSIFEVICSDSITLLRRELNTNQAYVRRDDAQNIPLSFDYYVGIKDQAMTFSEFKNIYLPKKDRPGPLYGSLRKDINYYLQFKQLLHFYKQRYLTDTNLAVVRSLF